MIEEAGFTYGPPPVVPNSMASLQLGELARDAGRIEELHPRLFRAYWSEGRDIGESVVLADVAAAAGLDADEAATAIGEGRYVARIRASTDEALQVGVTGVPAWVVDRRFLIPGAQPHEIFARVLDRLGYAPVDGAA
jgi:predicted DsbA family dithiol-disulfide isomerase